MRDSKISKLREHIVGKERRRHRRNVILTGFLMLVLLFAKLFAMDIVVVSGSSMEPTLTDGQVLILLKSAYWISEPKTDDIVVVQHGTEQYIKRIAACPGEVPPDEEDPLPENRYYILGDNRDVSIDSRSFGSIPKNLIIGRILE